jgi:hypothetical protein
MLLLRERHLGGVQLEDLGQARSDRPLQSTTGRGGAERPHAVMLSN